MSLTVGPGSVTFNFGNSVGPTPMNIAPGTFVANTWSRGLTGSDTFSRLAQRLAQAREQAIVDGQSIDLVELVLTEEEWLELDEALWLADGPRGLRALGTPLALWGVPIRVEWEPGTLAARRRIDKEEAVRGLLQIAAELRDQG